MLHETIALAPPYEKLGLSGAGLAPRLVTYVANNSQEIDPKRRRPCVLICPGGAYTCTSEREAEAVAVAYLSRGFQAFILFYSVAPAAVYPMALLELCTAVALIRENADRWHVDPARLVVNGFSAGGHLVGSLGAFWNKPAFSEALGVPAATLRPQGIILSYPVITSGPFAHRDSFRNLLGSRYDELLEALSLEKQVGPHTPPAFLWHTFTDADVPVENSLLMAGALRAAKVPFELHIFPDGCHGLSLAVEETKNEQGGCIQPECAVWIDLAAAWAKRLS